MDSRPIDVLLYGASGFTGRLAVAELARHAPRGLRWALAGRNRGKLEAARDAADGPGRPAEILEADSARPDTVDAAVSRARVVIATAGPFAAYGTPVVDALRASPGALRGHHRGDSVGRATSSSATTRRQPRTARASSPSAASTGCRANLGTAVLVEHLPQPRDCLRRGGVRVPVAGRAEWRDPATAVQLFESGQVRRSGHPFLLNGAGRPRLSREEFLRWRETEGGPLERGSSALARSVRHGDGQHPGGAAERDARRRGRRALRAAFAYREFMAMRSRLRASMLAVGMPVRSSRSPRRCARW